MDGTLLTSNPPYSVNLTAGMIGIEGYNPFEIQTQGSMAITTGLASSPQDLPSIKTHESIKLSILQAENAVESQEDNFDSLTGTLNDLPLVGAQIGEIPLAEIEPVLGDTDADGDVDRDDLSVILNNRNIQASGPLDSRDLDGDGNITALDARQLIILLRSNTDFDSPIISGVLVNDTALGDSTNLDRVTSDPAIEGTVSDLNLVTQFRGGFEGTSEADFIDLLGLLKEDDSFSLNQAQLEFVNGEILSDGQHILHLQAKDRWGNQSVFDFTFTLDTTTETPVVDLISSSDLGNSIDDNLTNESSPTLEVTAEVGSLIRLFQNGTEISQDTVDPDGIVQFTLDSLSDGTYHYTAIATDVAGNSSESAPLTIEIDTVSANLSIGLVEDTGNSNSDRLTANPTVTGSITDINGITEFRARFDNNPEQNLIDVFAYLQGDGTFTFDEAILQEINGGLALVEGQHTLNLIATDTAGNTTDLVELIFTLDRTGPVTVFESIPTATTSFLDIAYDSGVNEAAFVESNYTLTLEGVGVVSIDSLEQFSSSRLRLNFAGPLSVGNYRLGIAAEVVDFAGNAINEADIIPFTVTNGAVTLSPINGAEGINLTRETLVRFGKKIDPTTVNGDSFYLIANGERIPGRIVVSRTEEFANFFYDDPLPAATEVRIVVDGSQIIGRDGVALDADSDGTPGGILTADFRTLPLTRIEGTDVFGYVFDSYNTNPDGSNIPVVGATIRVDALPGVTAVTDENGFFRLEDMPAPEFFVHIDGSTAINAPAGTVYATVGKPFHSIPGEETQLTMDGEAFDIFLPPMATSDIQPLSPTENTEVGFGEASKAQLEDLFPEIDPSLWDLTQVIFPAGSAQDEVGNVATQATIIPVAPDRIPGPLPPNLDPQLVISIQAGGPDGFSQAGGATNFDVPAPVVFPNLDGLGPGEKSSIFSFNHDAGRWEIVGSGTVSTDGLRVVSDPGVGILAPGWHMTSPNSCNNSNTPPIPQPGVIQVTPGSSSPELILYIGSDGEQTRKFPELTWRSPGSVQRQLGCNPPPSSPSNDRYTKVSIEIDGPLEKFASAIGDVPLQDGYEFILQDGKGEERVFALGALDYDQMFGLNGFNQLERDQLYGSKVRIVTNEWESGTVIQSTEQVFYVYRVVAVENAGLQAVKAFEADPNYLFSFQKTINDGPGNFQRQKEVDLFLPDGFATNLELSDEFDKTDFRDVDGSYQGTTTASWTFDPRVKSPFGWGLF